MRRSGHGVTSGKSSEVTPRRHGHNVSLAFAIRCVAKMDDPVVVTFGPLVCILQVSRIARAACLAERRWARSCGGGYD